MTIYLIRHAQSAFNAVHDPNKPDPMIFDAPITELGETRLDKLEKKSKNSLSGLLLYRRYKDNTNGSIDF